MYTMFMIPVPPAYRCPVGSGLFSVSDQQIWQLGSFAAFGWVTVTYTVTFQGPSASLVRRYRNALSSLLATMSSYIPFVSFVFF